MSSTTGTNKTLSKTGSSHNALKHGVFSQAWVDPGEQRQFDELCQALQSEYTARSPTILIQIERLAMTMVKIRRLQKIENALYLRAQATAADHVKERARLGLAVSSSAKGAPRIDPALQLAQDSALPEITRLDTLARYQGSLDRQLSKIIGEIQILEAANKGRRVQTLEQ